MLTSTYTTGVYPYQPHTLMLIRYKGKYQQYFCNQFFNRQPLTLVIFPLCRFLFMFLGDFCKLNKTPSNGTCLGKLPGGFCDVGCCCCFTSLDVFPSLHFDVIPHPSVSYRRVFTSILYFQPSSSQSDLPHFHLNFSGLFRHNFTAGGTVLSRHFLPTGVFYLASLPQILTRFCN